MPKYNPREVWLLAAVEAVRPLFQEKRHELPHVSQVSCGFASKGTRSNQIGQYWSKSSSTNERNQIFISPALHEPLEFLDTLVHELVHAVDDCEHKQGKVFKKITLSLGMFGQMRSAGAGPELKVKLAGIAKSLGTHPNGKLKVVH